MILYINTTPNDFFELGLKAKGGFIDKRKHESRRTQSEKLLPAIVKLLKDNKLELSDLHGIEADNRGGSFTSLRIGLATANALAYALAIPAAGESGWAKRIKSGESGFKVVKPEYAGRPEITVKKSKFR